MIYLDYSATTFPSDDVLDEFVSAAKEYKGNPNSSHILGIKAKKRIDEATLNIANILGIKDYEIISKSYQEQITYIVKVPVSFLDKLNNYNTEKVKETYIEKDV